MAGGDDSDAAGADEARRLVPPWPVDDYEEAAMRGRLAARMFGATPSAVRIGRYEVADRIGAGGMGVVYSARDPELGRLVALKVLPSRRGDDARHRQRLIGEARVLARLSHPNVVQIHEVGVHEGAVFLALELVEGETLQAWQRRPGRRWQEILSVYVDAAQGLAAAHGVGIVHRDVKPSNILVGIDGRVRVVDFGLARELEGLAEESTIPGSVDPSVGSTSTGAVIGTPAYMSPEQARGRIVDALSDQFSLCVALFEGLHGIRPFDAGKIDALVTVDGAGLRRLIRRDTAVPAWILTILVRGLQPDPALRYPGMHALIAALREAPRRRYRRGVLAASMAMLAVVGAGFTALREPAVVCPDLTEELPGAWDSASKRTIEAAFVGAGLPFAGDAWRQVERSFDAAVLAWSRERRASCTTTWIDHTQSAEQFDLGSACLATHERSLRGLARRLQVDNDPRLVARAHELVHDIGDPALCSSTEYLRGPATQVRASIQAAVEALRERLGELRLLTRMAEYPRARAVADEILETSAMHPPLHAEALQRKAIVLRHSGDLTGAVRLLEDAEQIAEHSRDDRQVAAIFGEQVELATLVLRDVRRARIYARLYGAKLQRLTGDDAARAEYHDRLGELELLDGDPAAALVQHESAGRLRTLDDLVGRARSARGAANALAELGRGDEALERLLATRTSLADALGAAHPDVAVIDMNIGLSLHQRGELTRARDTLRGALESEARVVGADDVGVARTRSALAAVCLDLGDEQEALTQAQLARVALERVFPTSHDDIVAVLSLLSNIHLQRRDWAAAEEVNGALVRSFVAAGAPIDVQLYINAGEYARRLGRMADAAPQFDQALAILGADPEPDPRLLTHALNGRARIHLEHDQPVQARGLLERAHELLPATDHAELRAEVLSGLAQARWRTGGDRKQARALAREALALFAGIAGTEASAAALRERLAIR